MTNIKVESDFKTGVKIIVTIPESEVDTKAFYTMVNEKPDFILPFKYVHLDEDIEITYFVENRTKISFLKNKRTTEECSKIWTRLLQPLVDCEDWFLNSSSFSLNVENVFYDTKENNAYYVYAPSIDTVSSYEDLKEFAMNINEINQCNDLAHENRILRELTKFNLNNFLNMIKPHISNITTSTKNKDVDQDISYTKEENEYVQKGVLNQIVQQENIKEEKVEINVFESIKQPMNFSSDINIDFSNSVKKEKKKLFGSKTEKTQKAEKIKKNIFKKDIVEEKPSFFQNKDIIETEIDCEVTEIVGFEQKNGANLRYIGSNNHDKIININIQDGNIFTIGRHDIKAVEKQNNFEFDRTTKEISRRHAVIERKNDSYYITDLNSAAGIYVNNQKIPSNVPAEISNNDKVSFGSAGADYIFDV